MAPRPPTGGRLDIVDRSELADFLRSRRERVQPQDVGLEPGPRRRTPGLRREEVARLSGMSVDYYIRLEQARGPRPSRQVLAAIARALRLTDGERSYLFNLAGEQPCPPHSPPQDVPQGILLLLDRLDDTPAFVLDAKYDVLAWNAMAAALLTDFSELPGAERNTIRWFFTHSAGKIASDEQLGCFARESVADLRAAAARYPEDPGVRRLIADLKAGSEIFRELWAERDVTVRRSTTKRMSHRLVGPIELHCDVLHVPDLDQRLVLYTAAPGTPSYEKLRLLRVIGTERFSESPEVS
jgi:transcriptional regulator with XRE-family HTH domain